MMVYIGNTGHVLKNEKHSKFYFDPGSRRSRFGGFFRGTLGNRRRVGRVEVASLARGARESARRAESHCLRKLST